MFNPAMMKKIKRMTASNDHNSAYVEGAKMLGQLQLAKKFELVAELAKLEGHLPPDLSQYRYAQYQALMQHAKQELAPEEYQQFHGAF